MLARILEEIRSSVLLALPLIVTNIAQLGLVTTSLAMIGRLGPEELAAATLTTTLYQFVMLVCMGTVSATMPMLAQALGRRRHEVRDVRRTVRQGLWSAIVLCGPAWILLWHCESVFLLMGQSPDLSSHSPEMMRTMQWSLLPYLGYIVFRSFLAAVERPAWTILVVGIAFIVNAAVAWILVFGNFGAPALGIAGAGIASTVANAVMFAGAAIVVTRHRRFRRYHLFGNFHRPDWLRFREFWRLGIPIGITTGLESSIFYAAANMMGWLGTDTLAAHVIVAQITAMFFMVPIGLSQAATVRVGLAAGARRPADVRIAGWTCYGLGVGFMAAYAVTILQVPHLALSVFIDVGLPENAGLVLIAGQILIVGAFFAVADGVQMVAIGMLRGLHDTAVPMVLALVGYWGAGLPIGWFLAFRLDWGGVGVWIGLAVGLTAVGMLLTLRWIALTRR